MKNKVLYVIDIKFKQKNLNLSDYIIEDDAEILSLTPYSSYLLDSRNIQHKTFHDLISILDFRNYVLNEYKRIEEILLKNSEYIFLMRDYASIKTFEVYLKVLFDYFDRRKLEKCIIIYVTDARRANNENINNNEVGYIYNYKTIDRVIKINDKNTVFYKKNYLYSKVSILVYENNIISKLNNKYRNKIKLNYDNRNFRDVYEDLESFDVKKQLSIDDINKLIESMKNISIIGNQMSFISEKYDNILINLKKYLLIYSNVSSVKLHPFTFLNTLSDYRDILLFEKNNIPTIFMQHGSYALENIFLKYNEIYPASLNFVMNDFTKNLFEKRGARKVYTVGSINFNNPIIEKEKVYDFLYIAYCTNYSYTGSYVGSFSYILSTDGTNIFEKHKSVIKLFGTEFKDKKICIKIQPGIFLGQMLYIPLLELSSEFDNITIEFIVPISKLIEKSKYIISDYFSSEFINRELHYKRDIILFNSASLPLPEEIVEDMKKMFILVDTMDDLEDKVRNIDELTKDRKRYYDIIEYYSSKKCDTKKIVTEILEKELNARR